ncbi:hypothetical protein [Archaeoglobus veneficus]|uniref:hypothetical protein n=1 Tax=Archaeoglobus veneficus TaxID=58290 RepID=UPI0012EA02B2|nr:hypothetical protein [Archaeoglobus veneficus]
MAIFIVFLLIGILFLASKKPLLANLLTFFSCLLIGLVTSEMTYFAAIDTGWLRNGIEFVKAVNADAWACYSPFPLNYIIVEREGVTIAIQSSRKVYICKGVEEDARLRHRFALATGRVARREECSEDLSLGDFYVRVSKMEEVTIPHPREKEKVVRGKGFRIIIHKPFYWMLDVELLANLAWSLSREL